jgi:cytochrome c oxidase subunit 2
VSKLRFPRIRAAHFSAWLFLLILIGLLTAGCIGDVDTPSNSLAPEGEVAEKQRDLFMLAMWPALVVMILVEGGIVFIMLRWRRRRDDEMPKQTHGNTPLEIGWTILPTIIIIAFVGVPMIPVLFELGRDPKADAYPVTVTGFQWAWQFDHPQIEGPDGQPVVELGELHIPAGREIAITLHSLDVNHSFGVPRLAGTRDAVRGSQNIMWLKADHPGAFSGQCRELCGTGHAGMKLTVIAQSEEDFDDWSREMAAGTKSVPDSTSDDAVAAESGD